MKAHKHAESKSCCQSKNQGSFSIDPVCGMEVPTHGNSLQQELEGKQYFFCSQYCLKAFSSKSDYYLAPQAGEQKPGINISPAAVGTVGTAILLLFFFAIVTLANGSFNSALQEFRRIWYWILILASGFGFQLGLFTYIKQKIAEKTTAVTAEVAASGTVSTGSMVACCAHGLVNVLPLIGVSAAAAFLATYQLPLILIGVFSNLVGITIMLGIIQKQNLLPHNTFGQYIAVHNMRKFRNGLIAAGVVVVALSFFSTAAQSSSGSDTIEQGRLLTLEAQTDNRQNVSVKVTPRKIRNGEPVLFDLAFNTHSVDLSFDPKEIATLEVDTGLVLRPEKWDGAPPGGHHRKGTLIFKTIPPETSSLKLTLRNITGVPERTFAWNLDRNNG